MHSISGLIADRTTLERIALDYGLDSPSELECTLAFLPIDGTNLARLINYRRRARRGFPRGLVHERHEFQYLTPALRIWCIARARSARFAYISTEYHGGIGSQGAMIFDHGRICWGPKTGDGPNGPISEALALLGVENRSGDIDRFATVGLGRERTNDDWRANPKLPDPRV